MTDSISFRKKAVGTLTTEIGVYALCDLDEIPLYVGQSIDSIRARVQRHLTSARSDIIANRQIDVWEIAFVWAYPVDAKSEMGFLEAALYHRFHPESKLMNGTIPPPPPSNFVVPSPSQRVQVMTNEEIADRSDPVQRLPRQAEVYAQIVGHFLAVKNSAEIARAMDAHFERLSRYHNTLLKDEVEDEQ